MGWRIVDQEFDIEDACRVSLSDGILELHALFFLEFRGQAVWLRRMDIHGAGPNTMGLAALRDLARSAMEYLDVDELRIEGSARTTGAGPGRRPAPLVFRRTRDPGAAA